MGKVIYSSPVNVITGSIGGWTFQANPSGNIARSRPKGRLAQSSAQLASHQALQSLISDWAALSLGDQADWNTFASANDHETRYGDTKTITGFNWFISINYNRLLTSASILTSPPTYATPDAVDAYDVLAGATTIELEWSPTWSPTGHSIVIFTTPPLRTASVSNRSLWRFTDVLSGGSFGTEDITTAWETAHGLDWSVIQPSGSFNIAYMVQTIEVSTGISSPALMSIAPETSP